MSKFNTTVKKNSEADSYFLRQPQWREQQQVSRVTIPKPLQYWLYDAGSLTNRLRQLAHDSFAIKLLSQRWDVPYLNEGRLLNQHLKSLAIIREIEIWGDGKLWVFARSVLPRRTLTGRQTCLYKIGSRPLGDILFSEPDLCRSQFQFTQLFSNHSFLQHSAIHSDTQLQLIWGRRSIFYVAKKPLLVSEFFMPALLQNDIF